MAAPPPPPPGARAPMTILLRLLHPILPLTLATLAAFALAIRSGWADLSTIWTHCSSSTRLPTPLCFAISFFQTPLAASRRARLEEAAIVGLLAGLAVITSVEAASAKARATVVRRQRGREPGGGDEKAGLKTVVATGGSSSSSSSSSLSARIVENPAGPWLMYQLALGAFSWQGIIVPAAIIQHHSPSPQSLSPPHSRPRSSGSGDDDDQQHHQQQQDDPDPRTSILSIPLSITLGLLLPSALMLAHPTSTAAVLAWLVFPVWISLLQHHITPASVSHYPILLPQIIPILWSAASHILLLADVLHFLPTTTSDETSSAVRSTMLLLEVDHAAIFATYLYWAYATSASRRAGVRAAAVAIASALLLGPGAGVCLGWLTRSHGDEVMKEERGRQQQQQQQAEHHEVRLGASSRRTKGKRRATGTFFGGPDA